MSNNRSFQLTCTEGKGVNKIETSYLKLSESDLEIIIMTMLQEDIEPMYVNQAMKINRELEDFLYTAREFKR